MNNIFDMLKISKNPEAYIKHLINNGPMANNPIARNAFEMYQKGNTQGLNELAINLCKENGINFEDAVNNIKSQIGM